MFYLADNKRLKRDYVLGLRCKWLVAYAILPASLVSLGVVKIEQATLPSTGEILRLLALLIIAMLPLVIIFGLVRSRMRVCYLMKSYATRRALIFTTLILLGSTVISGAVGIIQGRYFATLDPKQWKINALIESVLTAVASLVVSSTLFATVLTKDTELPGLPQKVMTDRIVNLKSILLEICHPDQLRWKERKSNAQIGELQTQVGEAIKAVKELRIYSSAVRGLDAFLQNLVTDLICLQRALIDVTANVDWERYFDRLTRKDLDKEDQRRRRAINRLRRTDWG